MAMAGKPALIPLRDKAAIFVVLAVILGGMAYGVIHSVGRNKNAGHAADASMIYVGLPADAAQANATFRARVSSDFPLLTPEDSLIQTLSRQGFKSDGWFAKRMTFRRKNGGLRGCDFTASVTWETDDHGRVKSLDPRFLRTPGCLDNL
jgi:hypothetical protein